MSQSNGSSAAADIDINELDESGWGTGPDRPDPPTILAVAWLLAFFLATALIPWGSAWVYLGGLML